MRVSKIADKGDVGSRVNKCNPSILLQPSCWILSNSLFGDTDLEMLWSWVGVRENTEGFPCCCRGEMGTALLRKQEGSVFEGISVLKAQWVSILGLQEPTPWLLFLPEAVTSHPPGTLLIWDQANYTALAATISWSCQAGCDLLLIFIPLHLKFPADE